MKKIFSLFFVLLMLGACSKQTEPQPNRVEPEAKSMEPIAENAASYKGSVFVIFEGKEYETKDIKVTFRKDNESTATISMYKVKFVPKMPVTIDLDLPGVSYATTDASYTLSGNNIVPTMGGNPFDRYTATNIEGTANKDALSFSLYFGEYPTRYEGQRITE
ncbi:MAG: hypothetical protein IIT93_03825 [Paludibacteraceae bacterium]|nr:hypothetical protein [Paludibacteraceae bacterium]